MKIANQKYIPLTEVVGVLRLERWKNNYQSGKKS
jgi:hypothetical protein